MISFSGFNCLAVVLPEVYLGLFFLGLLTFGIIYGRYPQNNVFSFLPSIYFFCFQSLFLASCLYVNLSVAFFSSYHFILLPWILLFKIFIVIFGAFYFLLIMVVPSLKKNVFYEIALLMLAALWGMLLLCSSNSFLSFFSSLEMQSFALYLLAASSRTSIYSSEAAFKYFILGAASSLLLLFSFSFLYFLTGFSCFTDLAYYFLSFDFSSSLPFYTWFLLALIFLSVSFFFKLGIAPFHMWAPDLYQGLPFFLTAFFVIFPKLAISSALLHLYLSFFCFFKESTFLLLSVGTFSILFGSFAAVAQKRIKRLVAYSGIANFGFLLLALACGESGIFSFLTFSIIYAFLSLNFFIIIVFLQREGKELDKLTELASLFRIQPLLVFFLSLNFFSFAAVPPLAGFFSKFVVLLALMDKAFFFSFFIVLLSTVVSAFYYIRVVKTLFFMQTPLEMKYAIPFETALLTTITSLINVFFVLFFPLFTNYLLLFSTIYI